MVWRKRILVVDDNAVNLEIIEEILEGEHEVFMAMNGPDAIKLAERHRPHIVLLDIMLLGIDGYEICRKLRAMPGMTGMRIVMVSAKAMPSERARGFDAGADAYVTKPFDDDELVAAIRPADGSDDYEDWDPDQVVKLPVASAVRISVKA
jgi:CheY-like chemotaxis protein